MFTLGGLVAPADRRGVSVCRNPTFRRQWRRRSVEPRRFEKMSNVEVVGWRRSRRRRVELRRPPRRWGGRSST